MYNCIIYLYMALNSKIGAYFLSLEWTYLYSKKIIANIFKFHLWQPLELCSEHVCMLCICVQGSLLELAWVQCTDIWINLSVIFSVALTFLHVWKGSNWTLNVNYSNLSWAFSILRNLICWCFKVLCGCSVKHVINVPLYCMQCCVYKIFLYVQPLVFPLSLL